jgi:hypothetical protein
MMRVVKLALVALVCASISCGHPTTVTDADATDAFGEGGSEVACDREALGCAATYDELLAKVCAGTISDHSALHAGRCGLYLVYDSTAGFYGYHHSCIYDRDGQFVAGSLSLPESTPPCSRVGTPPNVADMCLVSQLPLACGTGGADAAVD